MDDWDIMVQLSEGLSDMRFSLVVFEDFFFMAFLVFGVFLIFFVLRFFRFF